ncbi:uncharacterized protein V6R79_021042 [Siganus canaliculatus]
MLGNAVLVGDSDLLLLTPTFNNKTRPGPRLLGLFPRPSGLRSGPLSGLRSGLPRPPDLLPRPPPQTPRPSFTENIAALQTSHSCTSSTAAAAFTTRTQRRNSLTLEREDSSSGTFSNQNHDLVRNSWRWFMFLLNENEC